MDQAPTIQVVVSDVFLQGKHISKHESKPDLAANPEGDDMPDHPVANLIGQPPGIRIANQVLGNLSHNPRQLLVQHGAERVSDIRSGPEQGGGGRNSSRFGSLLDFFIENILLVTKHALRTVFMICRH